MFPAWSEAASVSIARGWSPVGRYMLAALKSATATRYPRAMRRGLALAVLLSALVAAPSAYACACCAEPNTWLQFTEPLQLREVNRVQFGGLARVFQGAGGLDAVDGIEDPSGSYGLAVKRTGRSWKLLLGSAGSLSFTLPGRAEQYAVDVHDGKRSGGGGPLLYKELRLRGSATGSGDFSGGRYTLVLMGRGNVCLAAEDFTRWRLQVTGKRVSYALYGTLAKPAG